MRMTPEAKARLQIDKMLAAAGYALQDMKEFNRFAAPGVAVREYSTKTGPVDYLLFIDGAPVGVVEAKAESMGISLSVVAEQSRRYAESGLKYMMLAPEIRFAYESTGACTNFCDYRDLKARSREVFSFHRPETLREWLKDDNTLRNRMKAFPVLNTKGFRDCQVTAIQNLEQSFAENKPRALIQMATGAGKTYTAISPAEARRRETSPVPGGHKKPRKAGRGGISQLQARRRRAPVLRAIQCASVELLVYTNRYKSLHQHHPADVFHPARGRTG
jgi:type I restriction enzyme R subunit